MSFNSFCNSSLNSKHASGQQISIATVSDFHVHLRQGDMLKAVVPTIIEGGVDTVLVMPNLIPPLINTQQVIQYRTQISELNPNLSLLMTIYLNPQLNREKILEASAAGIVGVKMYPLGVTTNSQFGVDNLECYKEVFKAMEDVDMVLNLHGECPSDPTNNICVLNAEEKFLTTLKWLHAEFPKLRIVLEHVTSDAAVECVKGLGDTVACTITAHHLLLTIDDWAGHPHNYCHPRFFLGSDSAPHLQAAKESDKPAAGVFTSPILLPLMASIFDHLDCFDNLENFCTNFGRKFYKLAPQENKIVIEKSAMKIPKFYTANLSDQSQNNTGNSSNPEIQKSQCVIPFMNDTELPWKIVN
ncbi:hypothetical protein BB561_006410 [Smittium simulii]|uniref:Uncharacterized protein n=1 Tax=Smittium simulii TaxID=133385 RepID=A0A2T9Y4L5_9FUNG|nr:hypothetical protein BB561_006410 [Smittium simulii]